MVHQRLFQVHHWRLRRLIFRTNDLTPSNLDSKLAAAHTFIQNTLFNPSDKASLLALGAFKKKIIFETMLRVDLAEGGAPEIEDDNLDALWRLLYSLNSEMGHVQLVFMFKDDRDANHVSAAAKREAAPDSRGSLAIIEQNMLSIVLLAMGRYAECLLSPSFTPAAQKWQRYLPPATADDTEISDAGKD